MNEAAVLSGLKDLILTNEATLTGGLIHQGRQRVVHQVTTSNLTVITGYYFILLYATEPSEVTKPSVVKTTQRGSRVTRYPIQIEISDEAIVQADDNEAYETMHQDFRKFCDRLVDLIENRNWVTTDPKTNLERAAGSDRAIEKLNLSGTWKDTETNEWASLYTQLKFVLIDECTSTASLY